MGGWRSRVSTRGCATRPKYVFLRMHHGPHGNPRPQPAAMSPPTKPSRSPVGRSQPVAKTRIRSERLRHPLSGTNLSVYSGNGRFSDLKTRNSSLRTPSSRASTPDSSLRTRSSGWKAAGSGLQTPGASAMRWSSRARRPGTSLRPPGAGRRTPGARLEVAGAGGRLAGAGGGLTRRGTAIPLLWQTCSQCRKSPRAIRVDGRIP
jgi:hypothetical protein